MSKEQIEIINDIEKKIRSMKNPYPSERGDGKIGYEFGRRDALNILTSLQKDL